MVQPGPGSRGAGTRHDALFKDPMLPFYHAVALGVIGSGEGARDAQEGGQLRPKPTGELAASVDDD